MTESDVPSDRGRSTQRLVVQAFVALSVVVLAQSTRPLFPIMFEIGEDWDFVLAGLIALAAFSAPLLVVAVPQPAQRTALVGGAGALAAGLVVIRLFDPIPAALAIGVVASALVSVTVIVARSGVVALLSPPAAVASLVLGLALDLGVRVAFDSWDLAWQSGVASLVVVVAVAVALVILALVTSRTVGTGQRTSLPASVWVGVGAYLLLQLLFLQNFAFVASQGQVSVGVAALAVLIADVAALALVYWGRQLARRRLAGVALVVVALTWVVPIANGIGVILAVVALQPGSSLLLAHAAARIDARRKSGRTVALAVAGGSLLYLSLVLLWSLHIDQPLPVPRQTVPVLAALIVGIVSVRGSARPATGAGVEGRVGMAFVASLAVAAPVWLMAGVPGVDEQVTATTDVDLVSYNVRGSVGIDGQLAPDRIIDEILSSDPDIVVIQEAARGWPIHGTMDQVSYLQRDLGMDFVYVAAADGQFGNAVFSRLPMTEVDSALLPKDGSQERAYVLVRFEVGGAPVYLAATHLHPRSTTQVNALLEAVTGLSPLVVAGDMNIAPDDSEAALFTEAGLIDTVAATGDVCRTTSAEPTSDCDRPDWVFVTPDLRIDRLRIGTGGASDHLAIHLTLAPQP